jgi:hypothetical protein
MPTVRKLNGRLLRGIQFKIPADILGTEKPEWRPLKEGLVHIQVDEQNEPIETWFYDEEQPRWWIVAWVRPNAAIISLDPNDPHPGWATIEIPVPSSWVAGPKELADAGNFDKKLRRSPIKFKSAIIARVVRIPISD